MRTPFDALSSLQAALQMAAVPSVNGLSQGLYRPPTPSTTVPSGGGNSSPQTPVEPNSLLGHFQSGLKDQGLADFHALASVPAPIRHVGDQIALQHGQGVANSGYTDGVLKGLTFKNQLDDKLKALGIPVGPPAPSPAALPMAAPSPIPSSPLNPGDDAIRGVLRQIHDLGAKPVETEAHPGLAAPNLAQLGAAGLAALFRPHIAAQSLAAPFQAQIGRNATDAATVDARNAQRQADRETQMQGLQRDLTAAGWNSEHPVPGPAMTPSSNLDNGLPPLADPAQPGTYAAAVPSLMQGDPKVLHRTLQEHQTRIREIGRTAASKDGVPESVFGMWTRADGDREIANDALYRATVVPPTDPSRRNALLDTIVQASTTSQWLVSTGLPALQSALTRAYDRLSQEAAGLSNDAAGLERRSRIEAQMKVLNEGFDRINAVSQERTTYLDRLAKEQTKLMRARAQENDREPSAFGISPIDGEEREQIQRVNRALGDPRITPQKAQAIRETFMGWISTRRWLRKGAGF